MSNEVRSIGGSATPAHKSSSNSASSHKSSSKSSSSSASNNAAATPQFVPSRVSHTDDLQLSEKQQLFLFSFPVNFDVAAFSELELDLLPGSAAAHDSAEPRLCCSFTLNGQGYKIFEHVAGEFHDMHPLLPAQSGMHADEGDNTLALAPQPRRFFRIVRDFHVDSVPHALVLPHSSHKAPPTYAGAPISPFNRTYNLPFKPIGFLEKQKQHEVGNRKGEQKRVSSFNGNSPPLAAMADAGADVASMSLDSSGSKKRSREEGHKEEKKKKKKKDKEKEK